MDVRPVPVEHRMVLDVEEDVEVARRAAAFAGVAFAGKADAVSRLDARRDGDRERARALDPAPARTGPAGVAHRLSRPLARRAGALHGEEALARPDPAGAVAGRTGNRRRAAGGTGAGAGVAGRGARHLDCRLLALEGFLQRDAHVVAHVGAGAPAAAPATPAAKVAEHLVENVAEAGAEAEIEPGTGAAALRTLHEGLMAHPVIDLALFRVLQDVVGFVDLLEARLGGGVPRIAVRVVLFSQPAVGAL